MEDLEKLYQDLILDHYRNPRHACTIPKGEEDAERLNPTCGDRVRLKVSVEDNAVSRILHDTCGCAVSRASASLMADVLQGSSVSDARARLASFLRLMETGEEGADLGDLRALQQIREFPLRIRCATLPWLALGDVLAKSTPS